MLLGHCSAGELLYSMNGATEHWAAAKVSNELLLCVQVCADTLIGDDQIRGVSGGQRKRVTTGQTLLPSTAMLHDYVTDWKRKRCS